VAAPASESPSREVITGVGVAHHARPISQRRKPPPASAGASTTPAERSIAVQSFLAVADRDPEIGAKVLRFIKRASNIYFAASRSITRKTSNPDLPDFFGPRLT
jgi:hypothetical protein